LPKVIDNWNAISADLAEKARKRIPRIDRLLS